MNHRLTLLVATAVVLAACTGAAEETTTTTVATTTTTTEATTTTTIDPIVIAGETCDAFKIAAFDLNTSVNEAFGAMDVAEDAEALDEAEIGEIVVGSMVAFYDSMAVAAAEAPEEISDDLATIAEAVEPWRDALESGADLVEATELDPAELWTDEIAEASANVADWTEDNCDTTIAFDAEEILFSTIFAAMFGAIGDVFGDLGDGLGDALDDVGDDFTGVFAVAYGEDPELDALYDACGVGDGAACTDVYFSGFGEYEVWGQTCGATMPLYPSYQVDCSGKFGIDAQVYGDDFVLDSLWDGCEAGDDVSCDGLFAAAPFGSEYEDFGITCGGTRLTEEADRPCVFVESLEAFGYGDDLAFDTLWDNCSLGDSAACSDLYFETPFDSVYEAFGLVCGDLTEAGYTCENIADWLGGPVG